LGEEGASLASPDVSEGDEKGGLREEKQQEEAGAAVEIKSVDKVADDVQSSVAEEEKREPEADKGEEIVSGGGDDGELGDEKEVTKQEDKVPVAESNGELADKKRVSDDVVGLGSEETLEESTNKGANVEDEAANPAPASEPSPVVS
jgi:hypothetical protein